jgi:hypothetical protein
LRIDSTHRKWAIVTGVLFALGVALYVVEILTTPHAGGGTVIGIIFGVLGYGLMIFAALLSLRKRFPVWRIGRAQTWMRGHLWLGLLSYPLILFHAAFSLGGAVTKILMLMFTVVIVSGLLGALLQHFMPRLITQQVAMETIYQQISRVRQQLLVEADKLKLAFSPTLEGLLAGSSTGERKMAVLTLKLVNSTVRSHLTSVYDDQIRPYLVTDGPRGSTLASERDSKLLFSQMRTITPDMLHEVFNDMENICQEKRDLDKQSRYHRFLHGWLLIHVPLSAALIVLGLIHAIVALRF